jgi:hypothetical protein
MLRLVLFVLGLIVLIGSEVMKVYFIMPFPGSQQSDTINLAYFLHQNISWVRMIGIAMVAVPAWHFMKSEKVWVRWPTIVVLSFWLLIVYMFNFKFLADEMFLQPRQKVMVTVDENKVPVRDLVIGISINGESRAYPIEIIGYHHQVRDTLGTEPVMITYCTVCRTGRVFSPIINGQSETFRLVGMDHYNAMFEDRTTRSWWRQVNGEAIAGDKKGEQLREIPSQQMSLEAWINFHPDSRILQPDSAFIDAYKNLEKYDEGKQEGRLEGKDSVSWLDKSWIVGVQVGMTPKAYDWIQLDSMRVINDKVDEASLLVALEPDSVSFHVWKKPDSLTFAYDDSLKSLVDTNTKSRWNWRGECIDGKLSGAKLDWQQSYQEYWHSWKMFRPQTLQYKPE